MRSGPSVSGASSPERPHLATKTSRRRRERLLCSPAWRGCAMVSILFSGMIATTSAAGAPLGSALQPAGGVKPWANASETQQRQPPAPAAGHPLCPPFSSLFVTHISLLYVSSRREKRLAKRYPNGPPWETQKRSKLYQKATKSEVVDAPCFLFIFESVSGSFPRVFL